MGGDLGDPVATGRRSWSIPMGLPPRHCAQIEGLLTGAGRERDKKPTPYSINIEMAALWKEGLGQRKRIRSLGEQVDGRYDGLVFRH